MTSLAAGIAWGVYVGLPFGHGAGEVTCWSLVRRVYRDVCSVDLPEYGDVDAHDLARVAREIKGGMAAPWSGDWCDVSGRAPVALDIVLMRSARGTGPVCHVGLIAGPGMLLHAEEATGSVLVPLDHYTVKGRILGLRRYAA